MAGSRVTLTLSPVTRHPHPRWMSGGQAVNNSGTIPGRSVNELSMLFPFPLVTKALAEVVDFGIMSLRVIVSRAFAALSS